MNKTSLIIALSVATVLTGCASPERQLTPNNDKQTLLHAIEGTKLTNLINRLHGLSFERKLTEPEMDSQRRQITLLVLEVADGAESILDCVQAGKPELKLDADKQQKVHSIADDLRDEVKTLRTQTQLYQLHDVPATLQRLDATCTSCHELFPNFTSDPAS
jgi:hypothetical protein